MKKQLLSIALLLSLGFASSVFAASGDEASESEPKTEKVGSNSNNDSTEKKGIKAKIKSFFSEVYDKGIVAPKNAVVKASKATGNHVLTNKLYYGVGAAVVVAAGVVYKYVLNKADDADENNEEVE